MRQIVLILVSAVFLAAGVAYSTGILQVAPTADSVNVFQRNVASPVNVLIPHSGSGAGSGSLSASATPDFAGTLRLSGVSVLVFTAIRDTSVSWALSFSVICGGTTIGSGAGVVHAYLGNPTAAIWATLPASAQGNLIDGALCTVVLSRAPTSTPDLYWQRSSSGGLLYGVAVWGAPPPPEGGLPPPPGSAPPSAPSAPAEEAPPEPSGGNGIVTSEDSLVFGVALLAVGAIAVFVLVRRS